MNKAVIGILLLLISGLAGAFLYIRRLRAKSAESASKLQAATSQVASLQSDMKKKEDVSEELEQEKKARKAELTRIAAERKSEKARRDALEKMKNAKIAELAAKQKSQEAKLAKTDAQRKAALREANAQRAKAKAARNEANRAIAAAKRAKNLADGAKRVVDQRVKKISADARRQMSDMRRRADAQIRKEREQARRQMSDLGKRAQAEIRKQRAQSQRMISDIKRRADMAIRKERARKKVAQPLRPVRKAGRQIRAIGKIGGDPVGNADRYGAVPGYYRKDYKWAGDQFNVSDPNKCKAIAKEKRLPIWGHRNALHPNKRYKNSCYFYRSGPKYAGDRNDKIHMIGCTFGGNPRTGCGTPVKKVAKMVGRPLRPVRKAGRQIRAIGKIGGDPVGNADRYGAVPGYYRKDYKWAGDQFNVSDPNKCKAIAKEKRLPIWGHRNALHPNKRYKNSCYFYRSGPKYTGDRNDKIHMIGCTFGGNPRTGCPGQINTKWLAAQRARGKIKISAPRF